MDEKTISALVVVAVLITAGVGLYVAFSGEVGPGKSIEGAQEYYYAHKPYAESAGYLYGSGMYDLAKKLRELPRKELPAQKAWDGFCVLMFNPRSASIIPVPVGRHSASRVSDSAAVEMMETRGWVVVDVLEKKGDTICPRPDQLPTVLDIMEKYGL